MILDQPVPGVLVPVGGYNQPDMLLEQNGVQAFCNSSQLQAGGRIPVNNRMPAVLDAGGPLTNSVIVSRHGQDLRLDYQLRGASGATYQLVNRDYSRPPEFTVLKGGKKIASGTFEFG